MPKLIRFKIDNVKVDNVKIDNVKIDYAKIDKILPILYKRVTSGGVSIYWDRSG